LLRGNVPGRIADIYGHHGTSRRALLTSPKIRFWRSLELEVAPAPQLPPARVLGGFDGCIFKDLGALENSGFHRCCYIEGAMISTE
jgi:hypothetical protein